MGGAVGVFGTFVGPDPDPLFFDEVVGTPGTEGTDGTCDGSVVGGGVGELAWPDKLGPGGLGVVEGGGLGDATGG